MMIEKYQEEHEHEFVHYATPDPLMDIHFIITGKRRQLWKCIYCSSRIWFEENKDGSLKTFYPKSKT
jgi:hypothetical protein